MLASLSEARMLIPNSRMIVVGPNDAGHEVAETELLHGIG